MIWARLPLRCRPAGGPSGYPGAERSSLGRRCESTADAVPDYDVGRGTQNGESFARTRTCSPRGESWLRAECWVPHGATPWARRRFSRPRTAASVGHRHARPTVPLARAVGDRRACSSCAQRTSSCRRSVLRREIESLHQSPVSCRSRRSQTGVREGRMYQRSRERVKHSCHTCDGKGEPPSAGTLDGSGATHERVKYGRSPDVVSPDVVPLSSERANGLSSACTRA